MVADVQSWLNNPASNFGWLVLGDETAIATAKRFDTRESASPPMLTIEFTRAQNGAFAKASAHSSAETLIASDRGEVITNRVL